MLGYQRYQRRRFIRDVVIFFGSWNIVAIASVLLPQGFAAAAFNIVFYLFLSVMGLLMISVALDWLLKEELFIFILGIPSLLLFFFSIPFFVGTFIAKDGGSLTERLIPMIAVITVYNAALFLPQIFEFFRRIR